ncbi:hypothetical protein A9K97_gp330 [Tokyovirus A1]|uniref:hypothetical protein n=1 Tax=Tokyovirus A1 TaxID=1826170 RepID=UPI0007A96D57|nr:hypothetical protein A9K97_gp330 [Tokyovirus A1]BAU80021.1 hypothetical protein [Tokyovirus A1]
MSQEAPVIFQNAVDFQVFEKSPSEFLLSLHEGFARGVDVSGKTASRVVSNIYGCNPPSAEISNETRRKFRSLKYIAEISESALQTLGEFCQWREEKATKEHADKLLRYSGVNDTTRKEVALLALNILQQKFTPKNTIASCALAACFLYPSSLSTSFRKKLGIAGVQCLKKTARTWIKKNYPNAEILKGDNEAQLFSKVAVEILVSQASTAMDTRFAFWAPPALV